MEKIKNLISELENIYNILIIEKDENNLFLKEPYICKSTQDSWEKNSIEFTLEELDKWTTTLWKIIQYINSSNSILLSDFEYFNKVVNRWIDKSYIKTINNFSEKNFGYNTRTEKNLISSLWNYSKALSKLQEIINLWTFDKDNNYYLFVDDKEKVNKKEEIKNKEWLYLNEDNWEVLKNWKSLGYITKWNKEFLFFKFLIDNIWEYKTHREIREYLHSKDIKSLDWQYLSWIKKRLPLNIKNLISASKWCYVIKK